MKSKIRLPEIINAVLAILLGAASAQAESTHTVFVSGTFIGIFLGFCALLLIVQLIPAMMTLYGMIKGAASKQVEKAPAQTRNS